ALTRASMNALADRVRPVNDELRKAGREMDDLQEPLEDALSERDLIDGELDDEARMFRFKLLARDVETQGHLVAATFPDGLTEQTDATLAEQVNSYSRLLLRIAEHLAVDDPLRVEFTPRIEASLAEWKAAQAAATVAGSRLEAATLRLAN